MKNLGILLKKLRADANLTQEEFASKLSTSKSTVSKWENGSSTPDIETILRISHLFDISCDDLLHPTETLTKMASVSNTSPLNLCADSADETLVEETPTTVTETDIYPTSRYFIFTPKKILLLCIPIMLLGITLGVILSSTLGLNTAASVVTESNKAYTFVEAHNEVETRHGPAYELVYRLNTEELSTNTIIKFANAVADDWCLGKYSESTEDVLVISFYLPDTDIIESAKTYLQATYFKQILTEGSSE